MCHFTEDERAHLARLIPEMMRYESDLSAQFAWLRSLTALQQHILVRWCERRWKRLHRRQKRRAS